MQHILAVLLLGLAVLTPGCSNDTIDPASEPEKVSHAIAPQNNEKIVLHDFHDPQSGMVSVQLPLPASWQVMKNGGNGAPSVTGPNGLKIIDFPAQSFLYTPDQQSQYFHQQNGSNVRQMPGVDQLIEQDAIPWARTQGLEFVRKYEIPEITRVDAWYNEQLYKVFPVQSSNAAIGTEWKAQNGDPFFMLIHLMVQEGNGLQTWFYYVNGLQAEPGYFQTAKQHLIFGLANARYNPQQIQAYNQREAQRAGQSWAAHQQRMASNQANFEASQRAIVDSNNAVNDAIMGGWRERNAITDRSHSQYIDSIQDKTNVINPSTGQTYKVDAGANNYWINNDQKYITTDDYNYNPNTDPSLNQQNWEKVEEYR